MKAEAPKETAISEGATQTVEAPGTDEAANNDPGVTADPEAGKGENKPIEKKDSDVVPKSAFESFRKKEKERREKLEADLHAERAKLAKVTHLFEVAIAEKERLAEQARSGVQFDERGEELHELKLEQQVKEALAKKDQEHQQALENLKREYQVQTLAEQMRSELETACAEFPLASRADVRDELRKNPAADIRGLAQAIHEKRMALASKHGKPAATSTPTPTTVNKPTGVSRFAPPLSRKGMAQALEAARAKP
jgi:hypothetical protein